MKVLDVPQYSPEWYAARAGIPTASGFDKILTAAKGEPSKSQDDYIDELIQDMFDQRPNAFSERGRIGTPAMEEGRRNEPEARKFYTAHTKLPVRQVGFVLSDCERFGCSPDGLVGFVETGRDISKKDQEIILGTAEYGLELKCPMLKTQAGYIRKYKAKGELPPEYKQQVHGTLIVTGAPYWDFLSYAYPLSPHFVRVHRDEYTDKLEAELRKFLDRLDEAVALCRPEEHF